MVRNLAIVLCLCVLVGCNSDPNEVPKGASPDVSPRPPLSFRQQQELLFQGIDHRLVYQGCQELLRLLREGRLSTGIYYSDDSPARLSELPESIRALRPAAVQVDQLMVRMTFLSEDGAQYLECVSNEFGEPQASEENVKGLGFRTNPYAMDRLSGKESLDHLNATYKHFHVSLIPGLTYQVYDDPSPRTLEEVKRRTEGMAEMLAVVEKSIMELVVQKQRLLHRTDHHALRDACRDLARRFTEGAIGNSRIDILPAELLEEAGHIDRDEYARALKQVPQIILDLEPSSVSIHQDRVTIVLAGGLTHAGVFAYVSGGDAEPRDDMIKLIDGLWFYDDGIKEAGDDYTEYLKSLKHEALSPIDWRRKRTGSEQTSEPGQ
jgi:hypothetical protein